MKCTEYKNTHITAFLWDDLQTVLQDHFEVRPGWSALGCDGVDRASRAQGFVEFIPESKVVKWMFARDKFVEKDAEWVHVRLFVGMGKTHLV